MNASRGARSLLSLYPRTWRERYGEELLALLADTGLTPRIMLDVVAGAAIQRVLALIELRNREIDPLSTGRVISVMTMRDKAIDYVALVALVASTIALGSIVRMPWPPSPLSTPGVSWTSMTMWLFWVNVLQAHYGTFGRPVPPRTERIGLAYYCFVEAAAFVLLMYLVGRTLSAAGVPDPSNRFLLSFLAFGGVWVMRLIYCGVRIGVTPMTWNGLHPLEIRAWKLVAVIFCASVAIADHGWQLYWIQSMAAVFLLRTPTGLLRLGADRRRATLELEQQRLREKFLVSSFPQDWR